MKTIYGIITTILIVILMVGGLSSIFTKAAINTNLDDESINLIGTYDSQFATLQADFETQYEQAKNNSQYEPDTNDQGDEIKDFFDHKSRVDQLRDTASMIYKLPDLIFLSVPFVEIEDLTIYRNVVWFLLWVSLIVAVILALRNGIITEEQK